MRDESDSVLKTITPRVAEARRTIEDLVRDLDREEALAVLEVVRDELLRLSHEIGRPAKKKTRTHRAIHRP